MELRHVSAGFLLTADPGERLTYKGRAVTQGIIRIGTDGGEERLVVTSVELYGHRIKKDGSPYKESVAMSVWGPIARDVWSKALGFDIAIARSAVVRVATNA